jgi:hypothetical protein
MRKTIILTLILTLTAITSGCSSNTDNSNHEEKEETNNITENTKTDKTQSTDDFSYSDSGNNFNVTKEEFYILEEITAQNLHDASCIQEDLKYYQNILSVYNQEDKEIKYHIEYDKPSQQDNSFTITVIPNKSYLDSEKFMNDFSVCAAGYPRYPHSLSEKSLLFIQSCGSGFKDDSDLPIGCDIVAEIVEPTIKLK